MAMRLGLLPRGTARYAYPLPPMAEGTGCQRGRNPVMIYTVLEGSAGIIDDVRGIANLTPGGCHNRWLHRLQHPR